MAQSKLTTHEIQDIQLLFKMGVAPKILANSYGVSYPAIVYHTRHLDKDHITPNTLVSILEPVRNLLEAA